MFRLASWTLDALCIGFDPYSMYQPPLLAKMLVTISLQPPKNEPQQHINNSWSCIMDNHSTVHRC